MGYHAELGHLQLISTFYGSTRVFEVDKGQMRTCMVGDVLAMKLCLNPHSPRWEQLRDSPFARHFKVGLVDPIADEATGDPYIVDGNVDRSNEHGVLSYLERKYRLVRLQFMDYHLASTSVVVRS